MKIPFAVSLTMIVLCSGQAQALPGPATSELEQAARSARGAALASDPLVAQSLAAQTMDGTALRTQGIPTSIRGTYHRPVPPAKKTRKMDHEKRARLLDGGSWALMFGMMVAGGGVLLLANPIVTLGVGAFLLGLATFAFGDAQASQDKALGLIGLGSLVIGALCVAAPPLGAMAMIAAGAALAATGLLCLGAAFLGRPKN